MQRTLTGLKPDMSMSEEELRANDVWRQLVCRILLRHLQVFSGAGRTSTDFVDELIEAIVFCESDFLDWLCAWIDMDPEVYLRKSRVLFARLPKKLRVMALKGAKEKWKGMNDGRKR